MVMMKITDVRIMVRDHEKLKGFVTITLDNCFVVRGIKIIQAGKRLFLAMPNFRKPDGTFIDTFHPINRETRDDLERVVLKEYRSLMSETRDVRSPVRPDPGLLADKAARRLPYESEDWDGHNYVSPG